LIEVEVMAMKSIYPLRRIVCLAIAASLTATAGSALAAGEQLLRDAARHAERQLDRGAE